MVRLSYVSCVVLLSLLWTGFADAQTRNLSQVGQELHGGNPLNPAEGSILREFLERTGVSTVVRRFPNSPVGNTIPPHQMGPEKLAIAVGPDQMAAFLRYFSGKNIMFTYHPPNSNTYRFVHRGYYGDYARRTTQTFTFPVQGALLVPIILDDFEATRLEAFFKLGDMSQTHAREPWILNGVNATTNTNEPYSATSAYQGCTNWLGQIPIGREMVTEYVFPSGDETGSSPIRKLLTPYTLSGLPSQMSSTIRDVWRKPGFKQLGEVLDSAAFRRGEYANVGWVTYNTLGTLNVDRVPFMIYMTNTPTVPLSNDFPLSISPM
jgi:hypothetical protein